jgi:hypothetical protein
VDHFSANADARHDHVLRRAFVLILLPALLCADGGKLILHREDAGETISIFADPFPIRAGQPCDLSVLVQRDQLPVLDGIVTLQIGNVTVQASHRLATNKLLFATTIILPAAGRFPVSATHGSAHVSGEVTVSPGAPAALSFWPYFAIVPICIGLFALNRYLKRRREEHVTWT